MRNSFNSFGSEDSEINFNQARSTTVNTLLGGLRAICDISCDDGEIFICGRDA